MIVSGNPDSILLIRGEYVKDESFVIILVLVCIIVSGCTQSPALESDKGKIVTSFTGHQASIKDYTGTVSVSADGQNPMAERYRISVRYPEKLKIEYLESSGRYPGTVSILDASQYLEYSPYTNTTIASEVNPDGNAATGRDYQGLLNRIIPEGNISYAGIDYQEIQPVYLIEITPVNPQHVFSPRYSEFRFNRVKVWVDPESWTAKRIDLYDSNGSRLIVSAIYSDLQVNSGIPDPVFASQEYLQHLIITPPTHPPVVTYPGVEYPQ
jgi:outer membrane lipoprotein-sorting protein